MVDPSANKICEIFPSNDNIISETKKNIEQGEVSMKSVCIDNK